VAPCGEGGLGVGGRSHDLDDGGIGLETAASSDLLDLTGAWPGGEDFIGSNDRFEQTCAGPPGAADQRGGQGTVEFGIDADMDAVGGEFGQEDFRTWLELDVWGRLQALQDAFIEVLGNDLHQGSGDFRSEAEAPGNEAGDSRADRLGDELGEIVVFHRDVGGSEGSGEAGGKAGALWDEHADEIENNEVGEDHGRAVIGKGDVEWEQHNQTPELGLTPADFVYLIL
jgi:hypothetical protein